jgi:hypothetical protein
MHFLYEYFNDDDVFGNWHFTAYEDILTLGEKVKQLLYGPGQTHTVSSAEGAYISRQSAHEGGKVVNATHTPHLTLENILDIHFC